MAYDKNTWKSGDVVTSAKLNNIENGIASASGRVGLVDQTDYYDLTVSYNDLLEMLDNGVLPFIVEAGEMGNFIHPLETLGGGGGMYGASFKDFDPFVATSPDVPMSQNTN